LRHRQAEHPDFTAVGIGKPEAQPQRRGLACPVGAEQAETFSSLQLEIDPGDDFMIAIRFSQLADAQVLHERGDYGRQ